MTFTGIPPDALEFYEQLNADNSRAFWQANKERYLESVRRPIEALCAELADYGPFHVYRPYHDQRFAKGRPLYKDHQGAVGESEGGSGYYVQISASGLLCAAGYWMMAPDQLERFRRAVDDEVTGPEIARLVGEAQRAGLTPGAIRELKTAPRGYPRDHPRIDLLRRQGLMVAREFGTPTWLHTRRVVSKVRAVFEQAAGVCAWLDTHVGPSTLPPPDAPI